MIKDILIKRQLCVLLKKKKKKAIVFTSMGRNVISIIINMNIFVSRYANLTLLMFRFY